MLLITKLVVINCNTYWILMSMDNTFSPTRKTLKNELNNNSL